MPQIHSFRGSLAANRGKKAKAWFCLFREIFLVHENLGELTPAIFRDREENPAVRFARRPGFPRRRAFRGTPSKTRGGFTFPAEAAGMRQMECALPKAWFWHAPQIIHTFSFELTKEKVVI